MALLDFLKNKEEAQKAKDKKAEKKAVKASVPKEQATSVAKAAKQTPVVKDINRTKGFSYSVVKQPHISEKATNLAQDNKYTFKVYDNTNKLEIKKSVEGIYGVNVTDVNMITVPHKKRRLGKTQGFKKGFTKAVVTIKKGQKIEVF